MSGRELLFSLVRIDDPDQPGGELWRGDLRAERPYTAGTSLGVVYASSELEALTNLFDDLAPGDILAAHDADIREQAQARRVRLPLLGDPGVRDPDAPCEDFQPGTPGGVCETDGHYMCRECEQSVEVEVESEQTVELDVESEHELP